MIPPVFGKAYIKIQIADIKAEPCLLFSVINTQWSRDGGTGREDRHYSIISNPEKKNLEILFAKLWKK
jgi:hypothetical protein